MNPKGEKCEIQWDRNLLEELERDIEKYDKIILIGERGERARRWLEAFYQSETVRHTERKILMLSVMNVHELSKSNVCVQSVSEAEARELCRLHHMYEFSDRFVTIPETKAYGGLFNFVDTGLLQMDEVWEALLH